MPEYSYVARNAEGERVTGVVDSPDRPSAVRKIESQRCVPIRVTEVGEAASAATASPAKTAKPAKTARNGKPAPRAERRTEEAVPEGADRNVRLSSGDIMLFSEQLSHLLNTGMKLEQALGVLAKRLKRPALQAVVGGVHQAMTEGKSFSEALRQYPRCFSPLYVNLAAAGEASGALPAILRKLVSHMKQMQELVSGVRSAMIYPSAVTVAGIGLVIVFITVMVPQLMQFFEQTGGKLPFATQMLIWTNDLIVAYWWVALGILIAVAVFLRTMRQTPGGRLAQDRFLLGLPIYGKLVTNSFCAQFARTMSTLLTQGVTLLNALRLVEQLSGNEVVRQRLIATRQAVVEGAGLSQAAQQYELFPEMFSDMLAIGERSGHLAKALENIGDYYDEELRKQVNFITQIVPIVILLILAVIIGSIIFSIFMAVFNMTSGLRRGMR